jgi:hypothetical protein
LEIKIKIKWQSKGDGKSLNVGSLIKTRKSLFCDKKYGMLNKLILN